MARQYHQAMVHYLRRDFTFADNGKVLVVGEVPAGSVILRPDSGVHVSTAFNAGTGNVLDIGFTGDDDLFATDLALGSATFVPVDEAVGGFYRAADSVVTATPALSGTAATAGVGHIIICYVPPDT
jgi:hypothetical protein